MLPENDRTALEFIPLLHMQLHSRKVGITGLVISAYATAYLHFFWTLTFTEITPNA